MKERSGDTGTARKQDSSTTDVIRVGSNYSVLSDKIRRCTPSVVQCSIFCGGRKCKYENPNCWDTANMAIRGIYSHWITDDILAMARPCTEIIYKKKVIEQFKSLGIKSLINVQQPGEHRNCGCRLEESGFTYDPTVFMKNDIFYYNYGWDDYREASLTSLIDMVKIISCGLTEGKVAVHCHAGLGRTGVLIACYLVYSMRFRANDAIRFVRIKRPNSVQTRCQIQCVQEFEQFIWPHNTVFCNKLSIKNNRAPVMTLSHYLTTQKIMLHGFEARCFRHIPKIIFVICERLLHLSNCSPVGFTVNNNECYYRHPNMYFLVSKNQPVIYHHLQNVKQLSSLLIEEDEVAQPADSCRSILENNALNDYQLGHELGYTVIDKNYVNATEDKSAPMYSVDDVSEAILADHGDLDENTQSVIWQYQSNLKHGQSSWKEIQLETSLLVLTGLLVDWLEHLKSPIVHQNNLNHIVIYGKDPQFCLQKFELVAQFTIEYLFRFLAHLRPLKKEVQADLVLRMVASLTQQSVIIRGSLRPSGNKFKKLRQGTYNKVMEFCTILFDMVSDNCQSLYI